MATKGTILVGTIGQGVMMSSDDGESWSRASVRVGMHSDAIVKTLLPDPRRPATVYAGTDLGLYQTDDGGGTWRLCDTPMKSVGNITPVLSHRRAWPGSSPAWHSEASSLDSQTSQVMRSASLIRARRFRSFFRRPVVQYWARRRRLRALPT